MSAFLWTLRFADEVQSLISFIIVHFVCNLHWHLFLQLRRISKLDNRKIDFLASLASAPIFLTLELNPVSSSIVSFGLQVHFLKGICLFIHSVLNPKLSLPILTPRCMRLRTLQYTKIKFYSFKFDCWQNWHTNKYNNFKVQAITWICRVKMTIVRRLTKIYILVKCNF